jgi:hypothetical protein
MLGAESPRRADLVVFTRYSRHFYNMQLDAPYQVEGSPQYLRPTQPSA